MKDHGFPEARPREVGPRPLVGEKYERVETVGQVNVGSSFTDLITFSGRPDSIALTAKGTGLQFELSDLAGAAVELIDVGAGETVETHISRRRVRGRITVVDAGPAWASVVGKWAARGEQL